LHYFDPREVAKQLTLIDADLFKAIRVLFLFLFLFFLLFFLNAEGKKNNKFSKTKLVV